MIYNLVHQQTSYWAFIDLFYLFMWLGLASAFGVLLLREVKSTGAGVVAH